MAAVSCPQERARRVRVRAHEPALHVDERRPEPLDVPGRRVEAPHFEDRGEDLLRGALERHPVRARARRRRRGRGLLATEDLHEREAEVARESRGFLLDAKTISRCVHGRVERLVVALLVDERAHQVEQEERTFHRTHV